MVVWWIIFVKRTSGYTSKVLATGTFHFNTFLDNQYIFIYLLFGANRINLMSLFLNKTHQLQRNVYLTCGLLNKDNEQLNLTLMGSTALH